MPMNNAPPMTSVDRIRRLAGAGYGQFGAKALGQVMNYAHPSGIDIGGSEPRPAPQPPAPMSPIQQDFHDFTAPQPGPMLPPDHDLNTPVQYNPITGAGYVQSPKRRA